MPQLFRGNFDFEGELRLGRTTDDLPSGRMARSLRGVWLSLAEVGDVIIGPDERAFQVVDTQPADKGEALPRLVLREWNRLGSPRLEWTPWGWSQAVVTAARGWPARVAAPPLDAVREVNRRSFRATLELTLGIAPEGLAVCRTVEEVARALVVMREHPTAMAMTAASSRYDWVIKAEFGMAGRQAIRGNGDCLGERDRNWLSHRLRETGVVVVEPWLTAVAEGSLQFDLPLSGEPVFRGATLQSVDATGVYRGSRAGLSCEGNPVADRFAALVPTGLEVARRVQQAGYCGPLGLDVMEYATAVGEVRFRALQDLNARCSMGYLAMIAAERAGRVIEWSPHVSDKEMVPPNVRMCESPVSDETSSPRNEPG
jgi:hypothetical protein